MESNPLAGGEIMRLVNEYIGVSGGCLGDFSYASHGEFYVVYCGLEIDPSEYPGTTRQRFIQILRTAPPVQQARIIRAILVALCDDPTRFGAERGARLVVRRSRGGAGDGPADRARGCRDLEG